MTATAAPAYRHILSEADGAIAVVTMNRPERRNALSLEHMEELTACLRAIGEDRLRRAVVVRGAGPVFCAGHDLAEMIDRDAAFYDRLFAACTELMTALQSIPQPVIAEVQGVATAAGCQLVAACDLAVAASTARFATPGVRIGLFCSTPMVALSRAVGRKKALEMLLTGEALSAPEAMAAGLVNRVVPPDQLGGAVRALAEQILRASPAVVGLGKRAFYDQVELPVDQAYALMGAVMAANAAGPDAQEGMGSFLDKREPHWPEP